MDTFFEHFKMTFKFYIWFMVLLFTFSNAFPEPLPGNWSYLVIVIIAIISILMAIF